MNGLTVAGLLQDFSKQLGLVKTEGVSGFNNDITCVGVQRYMENETFWDNLNPHTIMILSSSGLATLSIIPSSKRHNVFKAIISAGIPCIVLSQIRFLPDVMIHFSEAYDIPLLYSIYDEFLLESRLLQILRRGIEQVVTLHGSLVSVNGVGVIITGESGSGKTSCAIRLARKGHFWIADDMIEIMKKKEGVLVGRSHEMVKNYLEIKDIGIIHAGTLLDQASICEETVVNIVVKIENSDYDCDTQRNNACENVLNIMGVDLPCIHLSAGPDAERTARQINFATRSFSCGGCLV